MTYCHYVHNKIGEVFDGIISGVTGFGIFIELKDIYVEGLVHITSLENDYYELDTPYRHYKAFSNIDPGGQPPHNYSADLDSDPTNPSNVHRTISNSSARVMRLHFSRIEIETSWDLLCIY